MNEPRTSESGIAEPIMLALGGAELIVALAFAASSDAPWLALVYLGLMALLLTFLAGLYAAPLWSGRV